MSAGTIALTNNSKNFTGSGTTFTTELTAGAFVVVTIGQVPYTLAVESVTSNTAAVLSAPFDGPTASGLAWDGVPVGSMALATMGVTTQAQKAMRMLIADSTNWRSIYSNAASVTVALPNGQTFTGPSWGYLASNMLSKSQNLSDLANKDAARNNLSLGTTQRATFGSVYLSGEVSTRSDTATVSPTFITQVFDTSGQNLMGTAEFRANGNGNIEIINRLSGTVRALSVRPDGSIESTNGWAGSFRAGINCQVGYAETDSYVNYSWRLGNYGNGTPIPSDVIGGMGIFEYSMVQGGVSGLNFLRRAKNGSSSGQIVVNFPNSSGMLALQGTSGRDYKHDIEDADLQDAAERIDALRMVTFVYNDDEQNRVRFGIIAEEAEEVAPQYVKHNETPVADILDDDGNKIGEETVDRPSIDTNPIVMDLLGYVKLLKQEVAELKAEIAALKG